MHRDEGFLHYFLSGPHIVYQQYREAHQRSIMRGVKRSHRTGGIPVGRGLIPDGGRHRLGYANSAPGHTSPE